MLLDMNFIPYVMSWVISNPNCTVCNELWYFGSFICRIFQLPALSKNPITLSFTSDNRFPVRDFFFPSLRCFIIKSVRWCIRLQYIYVEYNIMRPKESCLEKSFGTGTQLSQCWQLQGYASEISTEKHYKVQLILSILINIRVFKLSSMFWKS